MIYHEKRVRLPKPKYIVFYNGTKNQPDSMELKLSDCFENTDNEAPCLECTATMLNINYGHNQELMKHCRRLEEYSIFVQCVREYIQSEPSVEDALEKAIDTCIHQDVLADFLKKHRAEVTNMILTTYDKDLYEKTLKEDAREEGRAEGLMEGRARGRVEGREEGMLDSEEWYKSESTNGTSGTPGTDSNDDTTYMIENGSDSSSEVDEGSKNYLPNRSETITEQGAGTIIPEESSISVVLTNYIYYDEDELKAQGALDDMTFDEFVAQNRGRQQVQADAALYDSVSKATGIATDNISILCYEEPFFQASSNNGIPWTMILTIIVLVLIIALLAFVVFRSTRPVVVEEIEPETSVEDLIASTNVPLEDIEYEEGSEALKAINKFVDENPEAVANLLRNWLSDEWGE